MRSHKNKNFFSVSRDKGKPVLTLLSLWLVIRLISSVWIAFSSSLRPLTDLEKNVQVWPPSQPASSWLERTFLAPWQRWDCLWYEKILQDGYNKEDGTAQFHPLYPWSAKPLEFLGFHPTLSLMLVSSIFCIFLMIAFYRLCVNDLDPTTAQTGTILFITFPISVALFAPYPEALFLFLAVMCFYWTRQCKWWLAGIAGFLATLTRQQGIFLLIPMAWEIWQESGSSFQGLIGRWKQSLSLSLIPFGLVVWILYRAIVLNDLSGNWNSLHSMIYSIFISPSASKVVTIQQFTWPWEAMKLSIKKISTSPDIDILANIILSVWFLVYMVFAWKKMRTSYQLYSIAIILISFCYYTGPVHPYMGLPRHLMLAFPVFIGIAPRVTSSWGRLTLTTVGVTGMLCAILLYSLEAWVL